MPGGEERHLQVLEQDLFPDVLPVHKIFVPSGTEIDNSDGSIDLDWLNETAANLLYLRLNTANDPLTGDLTLNSTTTALTLPSFTQGSIPFIGASGVLSQNNSVFFWNNSASEMYVGGNTSGGANIVLFGAADPRLGILIGGDGLKLALGIGEDATIQYDGTNMIFDSAEVGTGFYQFLHTGPANAKFAEFSGDNVAEGFSDDEAFVSYMLDDTSGATREYVRQTWAIFDESTGSGSGRYKIDVMLGNSLVNYMEMNPDLKDETVFNDTGADIDFRIEDSSGVDIVNVNAGSSQLAFGGSTFSGLITVLPSATENVPLISSGTASTNGSGTIYSGNFIRTFAGTATDSTVSTHYGLRGRATTTKTATGGITTTINTTGVSGEANMTGAHSGAAFITIERVTGGFFEALRSTTQTFADAVFVAEYRGINVNCNPAFAVNNAAQNLAPTIWGADIVVTDQITLTAGALAKVTYGAQIRATSNTDGTGTLYGLHITASGADTTFSIFSLSDVDVYFRGKLGLNNQTPAAAIDLIIDETTVIGLLIKGVGSQTADMIELQNSSGAVLFEIQDDGRAIFQNDTDSTTGFQIFDANGGTPIVNVDTTNERFGLGTAAPLAQFHTTAGRILNATRLTGNTTLDLTHHNIFCDTDGGSFTLTLPTGVAGTYYRIINSGTSANTVTITPDGSELLLGVNSSVIISDGTVLIIVFEATEGWY